MDVFFCLTWVALDEVLLNSLLWFSVVTMPCNFVEAYKSLMVLVLYLLYYHDLSLQLGKHVLSIYQFWQKSNPFLTFTNLLLCLTFFSKTTHVYRVSLWSFVCLCCYLTKLCNF